MRGWLCGLALLLFSSQEWTSTVLVPAPDWSRTYNAVRPSVGRLTDIHPGEDRGQVCSATIIDIDKMLVVLIEQHCLHEESGLAEQPQVDGQPITHLVRSSGELRLVKVLGRPRWWRSIKLRESAPRVGMMVAAVGYGFAGVQPGISVGNVYSVGDDEIARNTGRIALFRTSMYFDLNVIAGQSGGPIVDADGRLVSIVRRVLADGQPGQLMNQLTIGERWADLMRLVRGRS